MLVHEMAVIHAGMMKATARMNEELDAAGVIDPNKREAATWSMFSNSVTPKRLGGSPRTAVIFSVGPEAPPIQWPPAACIADASAGSYGGSEERSMTSLSVTRYDAFGLA